MSMNVTGWMMDSSKPSKVVLPPAGTARGRLAAGGFAVRVIRRVGLEPLGRVMFQSPSAGSLVPHGTTVSLFLLAGPAR